MSEPTKVLYLLEGDSEPTRIRRKDDGEIRMTVADEMPENFIDGTDAGLYVFDGTIHDVRGWTEEQCEAIGISTSAGSYDEWWQGSLREATAAEILAVFAPKEANALTLATQRAEAAEAERDALRKACESFVEWLGREDAGCGVTAEERDTPEGEHKWRVWYDGNLELCARSLREAKAALAVQPTTEGL